MTPRDRPEYEVDIPDVDSFKTSIVMRNLVRDLDLAHKRIEELETEIKSRRQSWGTVHFRPDGSFRVDQEEK